MEPYRHAMYRYSTGQGFNVNVNVPKDANDVASFKMEPLYTRLSLSGQAVDINREADRVSMQAEAAMQQVKVLGYDSTAGKRLKNLKGRVELIKHLMTTYPIKYVKKEDLENLYGLYENNSPGIDAAIRQIVDQNKGVTGIDNFIGTAMGVRKGYPLYDKFGKELSAADSAKFKGSLKKVVGLAGFGNTEGPSLLKLVTIGLVVGALYKMFSKPSA